MCCSEGTSGQHVLAMYGTCVPSEVFWVWAFFSGGGGGGGSLNNEVGGNAGVLGYVF